MIGYPAPAPLIGIEDVRAHLKTSADDERDVVTPLLAAVTEMFEHDTACMYARRTGFVYNVIVRDWEVGSFDIPIAPIQSIAQVREKADDATDWTVIPASGYALHFGTTRPRLKRMGGAEWAANVEITLTSGWDATNIPPNVKSALIAQVLFMRNRNAPSTVHVENVASENGSVKYLAGAKCELYRSVSEVYRWVG
jgi:uncharacterized phiE125 gp8 family phage protein